MIGFLLPGLRKFIVLAIAALCAPQLARAQTTGRIAGAVKDQSGGVIVGAAVRVVSEVSGDGRIVATDEAGNYAVALLPPGLYRVGITAGGFKELRFEDAVVAITETTVINAELAVGALPGESITVSAAPPLVQAGGPQLGRVVASNAVSELPLATRNFTQILGLHTPVIYQCNASVQYEAVKDVLLEVAYAGTRGLNLYWQVAINQASLATP